MAPAPAGAGHRAAGWRRAVPFVLFVAALAGGLFRIERPAPWVDEAVTVLVLGRPWGGIVALLQGADAPLVPYYLLAKVWAEGLFWVPPLVAARTLSAVAAAVTVLALYALVARMNGILTGAVAAIVLIALPGFSRYAQEARPYALLVMTATLAWLCWDRWRRPEGDRVWTPASWRKDRGGAAAYLLSLAASVTFHLFGLFQWPAQLIADLIDPRLDRRHRWRRAAASGVVMVVAAVVVGVPMALAALHGTGAPRLVRLTANQVWTYFLTTLGATRPGGSVAVLLLLAAVAILAVILRLAASRRYARLVSVCVIWVVVPLALSIAAAAVRPPLLRARYWMPLVVPMSALAGVGIVLLATLAWQCALRVGAGAAAPRRRLAMGVAALVVAIGLAAASLPLVSHHRDIRSASGHALTLAPALKRLDAFVREHPEIPVTTTPYTRTTVIWAARPQQRQTDVLFRLDNTGSEVWPVARDAADIAARLEGHSTVLWVRARIAAPGTEPTPRPTNPPKALADLGFHVASAERAGSWWICTLER